MTNQVLMKRTVTPGKIPATTDIALGELAVNTVDGLLFFKKNVAGVETVLSLNPAAVTGVSSVNGSVGDVTISTAALGGINTNQIGVASGVASLDTSGKVPLSELPAIQMSLMASVQVAPASGTTLIPLDNTTPVVTEGTQIASQGYNPSSPNSKMLIHGDILIDCSTTNRNFIIAVFRDSTCIGVAMENFVSNGRPQTLSFNITDLTMGTYADTVITYSVRIGINSAATWYVNKQATAYFNGMLASNSVTFAEYL